MTEPIDNSRTSPPPHSSLASYDVNQSEGPLQSFPDEPLPSSSPHGSDSFSASGPLQLKTLVSVANPQQFGGRRSLTLENLLIEAASNPAAQDEIIRLVESRSSDSRVTGMCYASSDEVLGNILAQLVSSDPIAQREGRLSLEQYILGRGTDPNKALQLRLGALATVARISQTHPQNAEARQLLVSVYRQTPHESPLGRGIDQLSNRSVILQAVGQSQAVARAESIGGGTTLPASTASAPGVVSGLGLGATALAYTVLPAFNPAQGSFSADQTLEITRAVERILGGTHLEGIPSEEIVAVAQRYFGPAMDQFRQDLRRGVLGLGMRYTDFSGSHFLAHANLASRVAEGVSTVIFNGGPAAGRMTAAGRVDQAADAASRPGERAGDPALVATGGPAGRPVPTLNPAASTELTGSFPATGNTQMQNLAGMQGALSQGQALAFGPTSYSTYSYSSNPDYVIEPATHDEGAHDGFSGGAGGNQGGNQNPGEQEQPPNPAQPDSYLA